MAHLIDKDALVAEIEKLMYFANLEADIASTGECFDEKVADAKYQLCKRIINILNTLEVKEVDLEKEIQAFALLELEPLKIYDANVGISITMHQLYQCAKHFFELGLKAKQE